MDTTRTGKISIVSNRTVGSSQAHPTLQRRLLTPFDLACIKIKNIEYGLLFQNPTSSSIPHLLSSFSKTLDLFHPLSGRLVTTNHDDGTISISLHFTNDGVQFIHASAPSVSIHDFTSDAPDTSVFFPLNDLLGIHGLDHPLLAAQVTELANGLFIACVFNHAVADGASAWHFINTWSLLSRSANNNVEASAAVPDFKPWFIDSCPPPIRLPVSFTDPPRITEPSPYVVKNRVFCLSAKSVASLKARASERDKVSTLQSVFAHAWKAITRARALKPDATTSFILLIGYRTRKVSPEVPKSYFGNIACGVRVEASVKEVREEGLGSTAMRMKKVINEHGEEDVYKWVRTWCEETRTYEFDPEKRNMVLMGESNQFDAYGNDFGWGKPIGLRHGWGNMKHSGIVKIAKGKEEGGIELHVNLREDVMQALVEDEEFMGMVGVKVQ